MVWFMLVLPERGLLLCHDDRHQRRLWAVPCGRLNDCDGKLEPLFALWLYHRMEQHRRYGVVLAESVFEYVNDSDIHLARQRDKDSSGNSLPRQCRIECGL